MDKKKLVMLICTPWVVLSLGLTACSPQPKSTYKPRKAATATARPAPKPTPTAKPRSTPTEIVVQAGGGAQTNPSTAAGSAPAGKIDLPVEILYEGLGGGGAGCATYYEVGELQVDALPAVVLYNHEGIYPSAGRNTPGFTVCLIGMPVDTPLMIFFSSKIQEIVSMGIVQTNFGEQTWSSLLWLAPTGVPKDHAGSGVLLDNGVSVIEFNLWWPGSMPSGDWMVEIVDGGTSDSLVQAHYTIDQDLQPLIEPEADTDLYTLHPAYFEASSPFCRYLDSYQQGQSVAISGRKLAPNQELTLGIYNDDRLLMVSESIQTDGKGAFQYKIAPGLLNPGSQMFVFAIWDPNFSLTGQGLVASGGTETCFVIPK